MVGVAGFCWELGEDVGFGASDPGVVGESHVEVWEGFGVWNVVAEVVLFTVGVGEVVGEVVGGFGQTEEGEDVEGAACDGGAGEGDDVGGVFGEVEECAGAFGGGVFVAVGFVGDEHLGVPFVDFLCELWAGCEEGVAGDDDSGVGEGGGSCLWGDGGEGAVWGECVGEDAAAAGLKGPVGDEGGWAGDEGACGLFDGDCEECLNGFSQSWFVGDDGVAGECCEGALGLVGEGLGGEPGAAGIGGWGHFSCGVFLGGWPVDNFFHSCG